MAIIPGAVRVTGFIAPSDDSDTYPSHDSLYGKGGYREVATLTERDNIPSDRRKEGMLVFVTSENKIYQLIGGIDNTNYTEFVSGGGTGGATTWDELSGTPTATPTEIDQAVTDSHTHDNKVLLDNFTIDETTGNLFYNGSSILDTTDLENNGYLKDDGSVSLKGNFIPETASTNDIGSSDKPLANIYADDVHVSANSFYVNGKKVISDISNEMTFTTDADQHLKIKTSGLGNITTTTENGSLIFNSNKLFDVTPIGGSVFLVPNTQASKNISFENQSENGNISLSATGTNSQINLSAKEKIVNTAPVIEFNGDLDLTGNVIINTSPIAGVFTDGTFAAPENNLVASSLAVKTYVDDQIENLSLTQGVTFENLNTNGDVGPGEDQVALGTHNHEGTEIKPSNVVLDSSGKITFNDGTSDYHLISIDADENIEYGSASKDINILGSNLTFNDNEVYHAGNLTVANLVLTNDSRLTDARIPTAHDNTQHTENYITSTDVTFESLNTNGDVGMGEGQLSEGNHTHDYLPLTSPEEGSTVTGALTIDGDFAVTGSAMLPEFTVGNTEKLNDKTASYNAAADSVVISGADGLIDINYLPETLRDPSVNISVDGNTFVGNVELEAGNNIELFPNTTSGKLTISSLVDVWKPTTDYKINEVVVYGGKLYQAIVTHTSSNQFGSDMVDGYVKWNCLSTANVVSNWDFDYNTHDEYLVSASTENPKIINLPLNDIESVDLVKVDILKFIYDETGYIWPNQKVKISDFIEDESSNFNNIDDTVELDGSLSLKKEYEIDLSLIGTLGTGNYYSASFDKSMFKSIDKLKLLIDVA